MEQSWLYSPGVPPSAPGQAIQLPNPRPYATHSRAVLTWIFNSASGKENSQKCVGACSLQQSSFLEAGFRPPPSQVVYPMLFSSKVTINGSYQPFCNGSFIAFFFPKHVVHLWISSSMGCRCAPWWRFWWHSFFPGSGVGRRADAWGPIMGASERFHCSATYRNIWKNIVIHAIFSFFETQLCLAIFVSRMGCDGYISHI